jgi:hypothetical protein
MAFRVYGFAELREQVAAYFRSEFPDRDHSESGYFGLLSNALALFLLEVQARLYQIDANWPPTGPGVGGDALRQTETDILDRVAQLLGLPTNQPTAARPYGRDLATAATGGLGLLIGPANTVIPDGSVLTDPSGTLVVLSGAVNLGALGRSTGAFVALTTGPAGNLSLGTVLTFQAPPLMPPSLPSSLPSILPGGGAPWAPMPPGPPPAACPHCYCAEDAGTLGVRHVRCCKCGDRVAAPGHTAWCGSASQASTAQASPDPGPCLSAQSGPAHALAGFAGVLRRCPPEGVTAAGTVSAIAPRR